MPLSGDTKCELRMERCETGSFALAKDFISRQWDYRIREEQQRNAQRKVDWGLRLRFARPDISAADKEAERIREFKNTLAKLKYIKVATW